MSSSDTEGPKEPDFDRLENEASKVFALWELMAEGEAAAAAHPAMAPAAPPADTTPKSDEGGARATQEGWSTTTVDGSTLQAMEAVRREAAERTLEDLPKLDGELAPSAAEPLASAPSSSAEPSAATPDPIASAPIAAAPIAAAPTASAPIASAPTASAPIAASVVEAPKRASAPRADAGATQRMAAAAIEFDALPKRSTPWGILAAAAVALLIVSGSALYALSKGSDDVPSARTNAPSLTSVTSATTPSTPSRPPSAIAPATPSPAAPTTPSPAAPTTLATPEPIDAPTVAPTGAIEAAPTATPTLAPTTPEPSHDDTPAPIAASAAQRAEGAPASTDRRRPTRAEEPRAAPIGIAPFAPAPSSTRRREPTRPSAASEPARAERPASTIRPRAQRSGRGAGFVTDNPY